MKKSSAVRLLRKLIAIQLIKKFPGMPVRENCLLDLACPNCGMRERFDIEIKTMAEVTDVGSEPHGDNEWDEKSHMRCFGCNHCAEMYDFQFPGLDELIKKQKS